MLAVKINIRKVIGFTLIELLVVLGMASIILSLAAPEFRKTIAQQRLNTVASELLVSVLSARSEAIKNNQQTAVSPLVDGDWTKGWRIYTDVNRNRTFEANTDILVSMVEAFDTSIQQKSASFSDAANPVYAYSANGFALNQNAGTVYFTSTVIPETELIRGVSISVAGRVRTCTKKPGFNDCPS